MPNQAMPRAGDIVAGKYRIEEMIGEGGMGAVFAATHTLTGKRVALKWMLPELASDQGAVQRFVREAQAAGRIDHPNVVDIYDVGQHEGSTFLVMEYLHGETLTKAFERGGLDVRLVIELLVPAMRGVAAAHKTGVIHRDLKPDNIFLCRDADGGYREPKVLDFGISKVSAADGQLNPRLTRTGAVMGTPYYMSPEQIRSAEIDQRTDVYAFGVILYEALTGRVPFNAETYSALVLEIATSSPRRPRELRPQLPRGLEEVVLKAMARDPEQRYPSVEAMARALEPFADGVQFRIERTDPSGSLRDTATPFASEAPVTVPVRRGSIGLVAGGAILLLGALVWALMSASEDPAPASENVAKPAPAAARAGAPQPAREEAPSTAAADSKLAGGGGMEPMPVAKQEPAAVPAQPGSPVPPAPAPDPAAPAARPASAPRGHHAAGSEAAVGSERPRPARPSGRTGGLRSDEF